MPATTPPPPPALDDEPPPPPPPAVDDETSAGLRDDALAGTLVGRWEGTARVLTPDAGTYDFYDDETTIVLDDDGDVIIDSIFMMGSMGLHQDYPEGTWRVEDDRLVLVFSGHTRISEPDEDYDPPDLGVCVHVRSLDGDALAGSWVTWTEAAGCSAGTGESITLTRFRSVGDE